MNREWKNNELCVKYCMKVSRKSQTLPIKGDSYLSHAPKQESTVKTLDRE